MMNYYFDESGNWQEPLNEKRRLVLGGLLIKDNYIYNELKRDMTIFKNRMRIDQIHANEMNKNQKEELYQLIYKYISLNESQVLVYHFQSYILYSQTNKSSDELYIELASRLISDISFGDNSIDIEYDMKFHYAYPLKIINSLKSNKRVEYSNIEKNFILSPDGYKKEIKRVSSNISRVLSKRKNNELQRLYDLLSSQKSDRQMKELTQYIWSEFRLKIEQTNKTREKFRDQIEANTRAKCRSYSIPYSTSRMKIKYQHKHYQSVGVQLIDVICNLVWHYGNNPTNTSSAVEGIYNNITIKDIKDEI